MRPKTHRGTVLRAFLNADRSFGAAVELPDGAVVRADTLTRLEPGTEVDATFDRDARAWSATLAKVGAA